MPTTALTHEGTREGANHVEGALEVDGYDTVEVAVLHAGHNAVAGDAGVINEGPDVTEVIKHLTHAGIDLL